MEAAQPCTIPEVLVPPPKPSLKRRPQGDDGDLETGKPHRKRQRTTTDAALADLRAIAVTEPCTVGTDAATSEDTSHACLVESVVSPAFFRYIYLTERPSRAL